VTGRNSKQANLDPFRASTSAEYVVLLRALLESSGLSADAAEWKARRAGADIAPGAFAAALARQDLPSADIVTELVWICGGVPDQWSGARSRLAGSSDPATHAATHEHGPATPTYALPEPVHGSARSSVRRPLPVPPPWERPRGDTTASPVTRLLGWFGRDRRRAVMLAVPSVLVPVLAVAWVMLPGDGAPARSAPHARSSVHASRSSAGSSVPPLASPSGNSAPPLASPSNSTPSPAATAKGSGTGGTHAPGTASSTAPKAVGTGLAGARAVLQAYLRGLGNANPSVCDRYVTPEFANRTFGSMAKCRYYAAHISDMSKPEEVQALRTTVVTRATRKNGRAVVDFSDLRWTKGRMTAQTTQQQHWLGIVGGAWKIIG
jgi:hypothetical protein